MTLCIVVKSPSGLALAADNRFIVNEQNERTFPVHVDTPTQILRFGRHNYVAAVVYGQTVLPGSTCTAESFASEFAASLQARIRSVKDFAWLLSRFYAKQFRVADSGYTGGELRCFVAGFDVDDSSGRVFWFSIPNKQPTPVECKDRFHPTEPYLALWGGDMAFAGRFWPSGLREKSPETGQQWRPAPFYALDPMLGPEEMPILEIMSLRGSTDITSSFISVAGSMRRQMVGNPIVRGYIDAVTITPEGLNIFQIPG